jgi:hypothetical protein
VTARNTGSSNFVVQLVGRGPAGGTEDLLFNEIGSYAGQTAFADAKAGPYRVSVESDGNWVLYFQQPIATGTERHILGMASGSGARVIPVRADHDLQPIVTATHTGKSNFVVELIGYGDTSGEALLFNEIGHFRGQTLADDVPQGSYLLAVQADGNWSVRFTP